MILQSMVWILVFYGHSGTFTRMGEAEREGERKEESLDRRT